MTAPKKSPITPAQDPTTTPAQPPTAPTQESKRPNFRAAPRRFDLEKLYHSAVNGKLSPALWVMRIFSLGYDCTEDDLEALMGCTRLITTTRDPRVKMGAKLAWGSLREGEEKRARIAWLARESWRNTDPAQEQTQRKAAHEQAQREQAIRERAAEIRAIRERKMIEDALAQARAEIEGTK